MRKSSCRERGRERLDESMWQNSSYVVGCYSEEKNIGCGDVFYCPTRYVPTLVGT